MSCQKNQLHLIGFNGKWFALMYFRLVFNLINDQFHQIRNRLTWKENVSQISNQPRNSWSLYDAECIIQHEVEWGGGKVCLILWTWRINSADRFMGYNKLKSFCWNVHLFPMRPNVHLFPLKPKSVNLVALQMVLPQDLMDFKSERSLSNLTQCHRW